MLVTERGVSFGYNTLVSDMRALPILARNGRARSYSTPLIPCSSRAGRAPPRGGNANSSPVLARAAVAVGVAGVFIETHENPDYAPSDGPNMVPLKDFEALVAELQAFDELAKRRGAPILAFRRPPVVMVS